MNPSHTLFVWSFSQFTVNVSSISVQQQALLTFNWCAWWTRRTQKCEVGAHHKVHDRFDKAKIFHTKSKSCVQNLWDNKKAGEKKESNKLSFIFSHLFTTEYVVSCTRFQIPSHLRESFIVIFFKENLFKTHPLVSHTLQSKVVIGSVWSPRTSCPSIICIWGLTKCHH